MFVFSIDLISEMANLGGNGMGGLGNGFGGLGNGFGGLGNGFGGLGGGAWGAAGAQVGGGIVPNVAYPFDR